MSAIRVYFTNLKILATDTEKTVFTNGTGNCFSLDKKIQEGEYDLPDLIADGVKLINWDRVCFVMGVDTEQQRELYEE